MGRHKTLESRTAKRLERKGRGGGAPMGRTIGVSSAQGYGLRFGNEWIILKTAGQFYEVKYGIKFTRPEFERIYHMTRRERRAYCLGRMKNETNRRKAL